MANDYTNFIPEVWSTKLSAILDNSCVMMQCVNKDYEGEISKAGDTVHIRTYGNVTIKTYSGSVAYDDLSSPMQDLLIDQQKYFAFKVDDISKAQSNIDIMNGYLGRAKKAIEIAQDTFLISKYADVPAGNIVHANGAALALVPTNTYNELAQMARKLKNSNAIQSGGKKPWLLINPDVESVLVQAPEFIKASDLGDKTVREGSIGKVAGLDVLVCTNLVAVGGKIPVLAGINDAITYAAQITKVEEIRLEGSFDTAVRGLYVYGAKTVLPAGLALTWVTVA